MRSRWKTYLQGCSRSRIANTAIAFSLTVFIAFGTLSMASPVVAAPAVASEVPTVEETARTSAHDRQLIDVFNGINTFRKNKGLSPLRIGVNASAVAQEWSQHMADTRTMEHSTSHTEDLRLSGWSSASENLAYRATDTTGQGLVDQWIDSPGHNVNMSRAGDNVIGVGVSIDGGNWLWGSTTYYMYRTLPQDTYATAEEFLAAVAQPAVPAQTPVILGTAAYGETLRLKEANWPAGTRLSYQWYAEKWPIVGATAATLQVPNYAGSTSIWVGVTATAPGYRKTTVFSAAKAIVPRPTLVEIFEDPKITGTPEWGKTLTVDPGKWTDGAKLTYRWSTGETGRTHVIQDYETFVSVTVSGSVPGMRTNSITANLSIPAPPLTYTVKPSIKDTTARVGKPIVPDPGVWKAKPVLAYTWLRDGKVIGGATGDNSYTPTSDDIGAAISFSVYATARGYGPISVVSNQTSRVTAAPVEKVKNITKPTISGKAVQGQTLKVEPGKWSAQASLSYQWLRGGKGIDGATRDTLKLTASDRGSKISVRVTGSRTGFASASVTTAPTATVVQDPASGKAPFRDVPVGMQFSEEIRWMAAEGISTGWDDGTYRPLNTVARDAMSAFMYRLADRPAFTAPKVSPFRDVPVSGQFFREMSWLARTGVATGWPDGTYRPLASVNRDAMAAFMYRLAGSPAYTAPKRSPFADVPTTLAFYKEISWLASQGISTGWSQDNGTKLFRPSEPVKRDAMAAFMYRFDQKGYKLPGAR